MLKVESLQISYNGIKVLHGVSFEVKKGEIVALIGGNGCGKSTALNGISGITRPVSGRIAFEETDVTRVEAHMLVARGISMVPEGRRLFPNLSVRKNLLLGAYLADDKAEIEERLERVHTLFPVLKERASQKANTLSGGEQQMVAIGRGLMSKPKLLLLDEPSWGIAPKLVDRIFEVIGEIRENGVTILLVEQNVQEALDICDRAYVMQTGRIVSSGTGEELLSSETIRKAYLGM
jgi:branched-chain amino acid transport system ATP-binding protein